MVWAVSLSTTKLSPRRLTRLAPLVAFAVWLGLVTSTWPRAHAALYLQHSYVVAAPQCISGRTSYLHVRLAFHPYPPVIPQFCNTGGCEPRRPVTGASLWAWLAHVVSGPIVATCTRPVQTRFPCGCPTFGWVNLCDDDALAGSFYKRHAIRRWTQTVHTCPLTAGKYAVSGTLSSPLRGAFHLSLTVLVHYRSLKVLSLGGWSPQLPTNSPGFVVLRKTADSRLACPYRTLTCSGGGFHRLRVGNDESCCCSYNPRRSVEPLVWAGPASLATTTGISLDFSSSSY